MILFYDTETTGFIKPSAPMEEQPHCVQLAAMLTDEGGNLKNAFECIIKLPNGAEVPECVAEIHGISTDAANEYGLDLNHAMSIFLALAEKADTVVCHNSDFDRVVIGACLHRAGEPGRGEFWRAGQVHKCTMKSATNIVKIPAARGGFKWPKLIETHLHFFNEGFDNAHSAMADVQACARVYFALRDAGAFNDPS